MSVGRKDFDRKQLAKRAREAQAKGKRRRAISLYRELLAIDANDPAIHSSLAPLLAKDKQLFDALQSFRAAAEGFMRNAEPERALALYYDAAHHVPHQTEVWQAIARLQSARGKREEALRALLQGRGKFRRRAQRPEAIHLLRNAQELAPWTPEVVLDLARLLWRTHQGREANLLLEALAQQTRGGALARTRALQFRLSWHPRFAWAWFTTWKASLAEPRTHPRKRASKAVRPA